MEVLLETIQKSDWTSAELDLLTICRTIFIHLQKKDAERFFQTELEAKLLQLITSSGTDRLTLELACKSYFHLMVKKYKKINLEILNLDEVSSIQFNYMVRGILSTDAKFVNPQLLYEIIVNSCFKSLKDNSPFRLVSLTNLNSFCEAHKNFNFNLEELWQLVYLNMSSSLVGVRDKCLEILDFIVKYYPEFTKSLLEHVLKNWSWYFANKFYVLASILGNIRMTSNEITDLNIDDDSLIAGLIYSLGLRQLYSPGQTLFRVLLKRDFQHLINKLILKTITLGDNLHSMSTNWLNFVKDKSQIYEFVRENIDLEEENGKSLLLRNIFKEQLYSEEPKIVDNHLEKVLYNELDWMNKQDLLEILLYRIHKNVNLQFDLNFVQNITILLLEDDSTNFRQHFIKLFPNLLNDLIKLNFHTSNSNLIKQFINEFQQQILMNGLESSEKYSNVILGLKLYEIMLLTFYGNQKLVKSTILEENVKFREMLEEETIFEGLSDKYFEILINLLVSEYDDVQNLSAKILSMYFEPNSLRIEKLKKKFCEQMYYGFYEDISKVHYFFKVLIPFYIKLGLSVDSMSEEYYQMFLENFTIFELDPLQSIQRGIHVFDKINILNEIVLSKQVRPNQLSKILELVSKVTEKMLQLLSISKSDENDLTPSFEKIDESLQILINNSGKDLELSNWNLELNKSEMQQVQHIKNRKALLASVWMSLKASGEISSTMIENCKGLPNESELLKTGFDINLKILSRCRHKGAIEAAGLSFGRIIKAMSISKKSQSPEIENLLEICFDYLFIKIEESSYSRRGAGFSILFLNLIKNDKSLLQKALSVIFKKLESDKCKPSHSIFLHYLSVLVKDSSLNQELYPELNSIISVCLEKISSEEWQIQNAALQLFGSVVPKVVGQKQDKDTKWEVCQFTIEVLRETMPKIFSFILYCLNNYRKLSNIILLAILNLLSSIEYQKMEITSNNEDYILDLRSKTFNLLSHPHHKVRVLAGLSFIRLHSGSEIYELITKLINGIDVVSNENLQHGMILVIINSLARLETEEHNEFEKYQLQVRDLVNKKINENELIFRNKVVNVYFYKLCDILQITIGFDKNNIQDILYCNKIYNETR